MGCTLLNFNVILTCICICMSWTSLLVSAGPKDVRVSVTTDVWEGQGSVLNCSVDVNKDDVALLYWYKHSVASENIVYVYHIPSDTKAYHYLKDRAVGRWVGRVHQLIINKVNWTDEDTYICKAGTNKDSKTLVVKSKPLGITIAGLDLPVTENNEVDIICKVTQVKPEAAIYWRKGLHGTLERGVTNNGLNTDQRTFHLQSTYTVSFSRRDHNTHLYCLVTRPGDSADVWGSSSKIIDVSYPPSTKVTQASPVNPTEGQSVTLICHITDGRPQDDIKRVSWKKGGQEVTSSARFNPNSETLTLSSLDHSKDDGIYSCAAENTAGIGRFGDAFQLEINYKPVVSVKTPNPVVEGQSVTIMCQSQGARPDVNKVTWMKGQEVIRVTSDIRFTGGTVQTPSLTIKLATRNDAVQYTCQLSNDVGQSNNSIKLQVWYRPYGKATLVSEDIAVAVGGHVTLACKEPTEPGNPAASWFYWRKQNTDFISNTTGFLVVTPSNVNKTGKYSCVAGNWLGQSDHSDWTTVTVQVPPETPTYFTILTNSTSVALTLQWQPGVTGSDSQVFVVQYMEVTMSNVHYSTAVAAAGGKQQQLTVVGLVPETLYKFTLFAHNNNTDIIKSGVTSASGWTAASPELTIEMVDIQADHISVTWLDNRHDSRRSSSTVVSVVIRYQRDNGEVGRYPLEGRLDAEQQSAVISGQFDTEATYKVWLNVYEGQLTIPSKILHPDVASIKEKGYSCGTVTVIAAVLGSLLIVSLLALVIHCIWRTRQQSHCNEEAHQTRDEKTREPPLEMSANIQPSTEVDDVTKHYQHLSDRETFDTSISQGTYARLNEREAAEQSVPGAPDQDIDTTTRQHHDYVNTPVIGGEAAEYAEVT